MDDACLACGRDTAPGTRLFSARKRAVDTTSGAEGVLCQACQPDRRGWGPSRRCR